MTIKSFLDSSRGLDKSKTDEFGLGKLMKRSKPDEPLVKTADKTGDTARSSKMPQLSARAAQAIRRFSNPFRQDQVASAWEKPTAILEMKEFCSSYESLESEPVQLRGRHQQGKEEATVRPGTRPACGWDSPSLPWGTFDERQSGPSVRRVGGISNDGHALQERFPSGFPPLPFPLISLPEAARLQYFRRERGEEDHTDSAGSFAAKARSARSGTLSTMSSLLGPATPLSPFGDLPTVISAAGTARPSAAYQSHCQRMHPSCRSPFALKQCSPELMDCSEPGHLVHAASSLVGLAQLRVDRIPSAMGRFSMRVRFPRTSVRSLATEACKTGAGKFRAIHTFRGGSHRVCQRRHALPPGPRGGRRQAAKIFVSRNHDCDHLVSPGRPGGSLRAI